MENEVTIVKSETWMQAGLEEEDNILNSAILDFVGEDERIINIQLIDSLGLKRFWIYTQKRSVLCISHSQL